MAARVLRLLALLIVVAAIIDPAVSSARRTRPVISVIGSDPSRDSLLVSHVARALDNQYTVVRAPLASAAGTVLVGRRVPDAAQSLAAPVFTVTPVSNRPAISLRRIEAPARAMLDARITVVATPVVRGITSATARDAHIELLHGETVVSRTQQRVAHDSAWSVTLTFVPTVAEPATLTIRAWLEGNADTLRHDLLVDVRANRWSVLFFDRRPSWISTFVRRALERDPRFAVTSRVITSTNVSRETGRAPAGLDVVAATSAFDAVVIGAPEALTARDVDGLGMLLRSRGASVLVLPDHPSAGPADALLGFGAWRTPARRVAGDVVSTPGSTDHDAIRLKGLSLGTPTRLPEHAHVIAVARDSARSAERALPVIWRSPVGLGQLYVSGAFDAWRFRDTSMSTFDATWRDLVDDAASARQLPIELQVTPRRVTPRGEIAITAHPRDSLTAAAVLLSLRAMSGSVDTGSVTRIAGTVRGRAYEARVRAPLDTGAYDILAVLGADTARVPIMVSPVVARDAANDPDLLAAWTGSRGGRVFERDSLVALANALDDALQPVPRVTEWHPMRSPWWILPFALALSGEWMIRRRRGLA